MENHNNNIKDLEKLLKEEEYKFMKHNSPKKEEIISLLTSICSLGATIPLEGLLEFLSITLMMTSGINWYMGTQNYQNVIMQNAMLKVREYMENTKEYEICQKLYNDLLEETAELFVKLSADKDPLLLGILHRELLHYGIFSKDNEFNYHDYEKDFGIHYDNLGARICSGTGVCRHIAKNSVDLYRILGHTAFCCQVRTLNKKNLYLKNEKLLNKINPFPNHAVTGVVGKDGKFIVDATNYTIANINENEKLATTLLGERTYYFNQKKIYTKNKELEIESYEKFIGAPRKIITLEEYDEVKEEILNIIKYNFIALGNYLGRIEPLVEEISHYEKLLSQYEDKKPKKTLKIRKR